MKITVISSSAAGRYCFFLGMVKNLLLKCNDAVGYIDASRRASYLYEKIFEMSDQTLPVYDRIPDPRDCNMICKLHMDDCHNERIPIEWVDIKSEHLVVGCYDWDWDNVRGSDCIMACLDGDLIADAIRKKQDIADYLYDEIGAGRDIDHFLQNFLRYNGEKLPFLCFVVTKMDLLALDLVNSVRLDRIVKRTFPQWFEGRLRHGGHISAICPISALGYKFMDGGPFCPFNAEKPLLAALKVVCGKTYGDLKGVRFYKNGKLIDESEL